MSDLLNPFGVHEQALGARTRRLELIASNIANADTPNFKARDIDFRAVLNGVQGDDLSTAGAIRWDSDTFNLETSWMVVDPKFRDDLGFVPRLDQRTSSSQIGFKPRINGVDASLGLSRRLNGPHGEFKGIVVGTLRLNYFRRLFDGLNLGPRATVTLVRSDGTLLMRRPYNETLIGRSLADSPAFQRRLLSPEGSYVEMAATDGIERLFSFRHIGEHPLIVAVGLATEDIYAEWRQRAWVIGSIVLLLDAVFMTLSVLFAKQLRKRLEMEQQLQWLANTDGLTGLGTRRALDATLYQPWLNPDDNACQQFFIPQTLDNLLGGQTFRNCDRVQDLLARNKIIDHILNAGIGFEGIFAKANIGPFTLPPKSQFEQSGTIDDALLLKLIDDLQHIRARCNVDDLFTTQGTRL